MIQDYTTVCSALSGKCSKCLGKLNLNMSFLNDNTNSLETIELQFKIIDMNYDVIVGRPAIKQFNLLQKLYKHLSSETISCDSAQTCATKVSPTDPVHSGTVVPDQSTAPSTVSRVQQLAQLWQIDHVSKFIDQVEDTDGIPLVDDVMMTSPRGKGPPIN